MKFYPNFNQILSDFETLIKDIEDIRQRIAHYNFLLFISPE